MGREEIVNRILSDAEAEAAEIVRSAEAKAAEIIAAAKARADEDRAQTVAEATEQSRRTAEVKAAAARLDSAKILLAEKRRVLDEIYARALKKLLTLGEKESLALLEKLLKENAEEGDEIVLAENYPYAKGAAKLPVVAERKLVFSATRAKIDGGCILRGKLCDKDLSYAALLNADKEEYQADIAAKLFAAK